MSLLKEPMHPGEVLKKLHLDPVDMGAIAFARRLDVPRTLIERLVKRVTKVTPVRLYALPALSTQPQPTG